MFNISTVIKRSSDSLYAYEGYGITKINRSEKVIFGKISTKEYFCNKHNKRKQRIVQELYNKPILVHDKHRIICMLLNKPFNLTEAGKVQLRHNEFPIRMFMDVIFFSKSIRHKFDIASILYAHYVDYNHNLLCETVFPFIPSPFFRESGRKTIIFFNIMKKINMIVFIYLGRCCVCDVSVIVCWVWLSCCALNSDRLHTQCYCLQNRLELVSPCSDYDAIDSANQAKIVLTF